MDPFRRREVPGSPGRCPRCDEVALEPKLVRDLTVAICLACRGVWIDGAGLVELFTANEESLSRLAHDDAVTARDRPQPAPCVRCRRTMLRETGSSGVAYDACGLHGLWFDEGELRALLVYAGIKPGRINRPPDEPPASSSGSLDIGDILEAVGCILSLFDLRGAHEHDKEAPAGSK